MPTRNPAIEYINPIIPDFEMPRFRGARYEAKVPDTLDLAERAHHAIHGLTACADRDANCEIYWRAWFGWQPPTMYHDFNDRVEYKFFAPSMLLRQMCGSEEALDVEWQRMATILQMRGPDGLLYSPTTGRPWALEGDEFGNVGEAEVRNVGHHTMDLPTSGRALEAAAVYHAMTGDVQWDNLARRMVLAFHRMAIDMGDYAYFDKSQYGLGEKPSKGPLPPPPVNFYYIWLGSGLATYYRMTGCEEALDLSYKLARFYSLGHSGFIGPEGEFRLSPADVDPNRPGGCVHFHTHTLMRTHLLEAAIGRGDKEMIELALRGYRYGRNHPESDALMGYFPENLGPADAPWMRKTLEICEVADMIYLALRQSTAGLADCWDDVDRWVRNMFAEMQLLETDWAYDFSQKHGRPRTPPYNPQHMSFDHVPDRWRGAWGGWGSPNDWQGDPTNSVMACCVGNGATQLYRVWRDMIQFDAPRNRLSIHLLLNRASTWADIDSHIPYRGQVDIRIKCDCDIALRIPEWAIPAQCRMFVNQTAASPAWENRYMVIKGVKEGMKLTWQCPIHERTESHRIVEKEYRVIVRGSDIVHIDPPGVHHPLFNRPHYRSADTRWRTVNRFVSDQVIERY
ncbi:MAG: hypothetical protein IT446_14865 [Phycisphaerales bacterium]|nr:hypothetical protein [Phycisphaerales bacterium]